MRRLKFIVVLVVLFCTKTNHLYAQQNSIQSTIFEKGRWFSGLSGSINTVSNKFNSNSEEKYNNFGLSFKSGYFLQKRFLLGGIIRADRTQSGRELKTSNETFFIAPFINYYLNDSPFGSIYTSFALGYVRYDNETEVLLNDNKSQENTYGNGLGSIVGLGYAYSLNRNVIFELGVNVTFYKVNLKTEDETIIEPDFDSVRSNTLSFNFGFNVILDEFFF